MSLKDYSRKRNFARTSEPPPALSDVKMSRFVVQRHHARRLHYDLRLEIAGVLKSWAVPLGPTLDPKLKRLAVQVEDHPIEYGGFEGTIPQGNYGAGTVTVWDKGTFEVIGDVALEQQLERGDFKFQLHGHKLMGNFALVRIKKSSKAEWLLLKKPDFAAQEDWNAEDHLESVVTQALDPAIIPGTRSAAMPELIKPMLATLDAKVPEGTDWVYEIKWDGFRGICFLKDGKLNVFSRNGRALNPQFPELQEAATNVRAQTAIMDGEIVAFDGSGRPSFSLMQQRTGFATSKERAHAPVRFIAFDLLYLNGYDLRDAALSDRQRLLRDIVTPSARISTSEVYSGAGVEILDVARQHGLEGVVAKRLDCRYESGRSRNWVKVKFVTQQEFVVCGFTVVNRKPISSLVLGYYDGGGLVWAGNVGTGFSDKTLVDLHEILSQLVVKKSPLSKKEAIDDVTWVQPKLVCTAQYTGWGSDDHLRAPVFVALRPDQDPRDCVRETSPAPEPAVRTKLIDGKRNDATIQIDGRPLKLTNLNKVFYPADGYTKGDVIEYYNDVAPLLVPHLLGRPLSLKRYPNGIEADFFFQKDASRGLASWLRTEKVRESDDGPLKPFVLCEDRATLLYLANLGCIDQNPWLSRVDSLDCPDFVVLDLDPYQCGFDRIIEAAQLVRRKLETLELESYPKTTGGDGMHVYVPIAADYTYEQIRTFAEIIARLVNAERPDLFTTPRSVSQREKGRVYFDYLQISRAKTISAPYVLRAYAGAPVATPLRWAEVKASLSPTSFTLRNVRSRFDRLGDIFAPVLRNHQRIEPALKKLESIMRPR